jgi:hypothetical protein
MAIQISGTTVINNTLDIVNARHGSYTGIVTAAQFVGDGALLTNTGLSASRVFYISARK